MDLRTEREELLAAWRALAGQKCGDGWQTIPVALGGPCRLRAGRFFPGNEEALLVGFISARVPAANQLPQGRGFQVLRADIEGEGDPCEWVALCRQSEGQIDLFAMMAVDIVSTLAGLSPDDDERIVQVFLSRIRAWQEFMRRSEDGVLNAEEEVGLFGELEFLRRLIASEVPILACIDAWKGPLDGLQDFYLGAGAIEVKSTLSEHGFSAVVGSLEQLDNSLIQPLFLAGVRLALGAAGRTLPELISDVQRSLADVPSALADLSALLLHAGYFNDFAGLYVRRFTCRGIRILSVGDDFPKLTKGSVAIAIRAARYEIDLDLVAVGDVGLMAALKQLGVA